MYICIMEENTTREIGGSRMAIWYGNQLGKVAKYYQKRSDKLIAKGTKTIVSNPACKFFNAFTLIFTFTVDNTDKYQLVHQGDFKEKYKVWKGKVDLYNTNLKVYEDKLALYEALKDKSGEDAPIAPEKVADSPIGVKEMFMVILANEKKWFLKG